MQNASWCFQRGWTLKFKIWISDQTSNENTDKFRQMKANSRSYLVNGIYKRLKDQAMLISKLGRFWNLHRALPIALRIDSNFEVQFEPFKISLNLLLKSKTRLNQIGCKNINRKRCSLDFRGLLAHIVDLVEHWWHPRPLWDLWLVWFLNNSATKLESLKKLTLNSPDNGLR